MNEDKDFLAKEPIGKLLLRLAIPTVAAQMINMLYNIVDRIYIGHIPDSGALALTGVGVCMPPYYDHFRFCSAGREWWSTKSVHYDGKRGTGDSREDSG